MKKSFLVLLAFCAFIFSVMEASENSRSRLVLVSVAPYKLFVEKIAGSTVQVILMVPPGASSHTYEPTPKQMVAASQADLWLTLGEPFEERAIQALKSHRSAMEILDMRQDLDLIADRCCHCHGCRAGADPHIWLSPALVKTQAINIEKALSQLYPENQKIYKENLGLFLQELAELDAAIKECLYSINNRSIMVSHPAYAYFCRDYNLKQLSVEFEGKDPTPKQISSILKEAKENHISIIFTQRQYSNKAASLIAKEIGAELKTLDPYAEDYFNSMREIALNFAEKASGK